MRLNKDCGHTKRGVEANSKRLDKKNNESKTRIKPKPNLNLLKRQSFDAGSNKANRNQLEDAKGLPTSCSKIKGHSRLAESATIFLGSNRI